ncbi:Uncharacterized UPF0126 inner membrane protein [Olavius algarvensis Delta 1 endosymbiont]|nr:Uncharacterized UPF0126 inner membrane protein [Olavius algarvensis Delta 1 endosymbiont]
MESLIYWIGMAGTVAFTVSAVLTVLPKGTNLWSASVFGIITAIGGGTIRDVILDVPVFWAVDLNYIWVSLGASLAVFISQNFFTRKLIYSSILYLDGFGVALFAIEAADKVWYLAFGRPLAPIILGIVTAIGGGLIRDVLAGRQTLLMGRELYAIPVLLGCTFYVALLGLLPAFRLNGAVVCCLCIFGLRAAAIHWDLSVPEWLAMRPKSGQG